MRGAFKHRNRKVVYKLVRSDCGCGHQLRVRINGVEVFRLAIPEEHEAIERAKRLIDSNPHVVWNK